MSGIDNFQTPMMRQYASIKAEYSDAILFFRLGDFYEMFLDDAKIGAKVLGITLTSRHKGKDGDIPMCGVPFHAAESYVQKLVRNGYKVAICEQITEPTQGSEIVERDVIRVVTPSTLLDDTDSKSNGSDLLMTYHVAKKRLGVSLISVQSGAVYVSEKTMRDMRETDVIRSLTEIVARFQPVEVLLSRDDFNQQKIRAEFNRLGVSPFVDDLFVTKPADALEVIKKQFGVSSVEGFGMHDKLNAQIALANGLSYLQKTQRTGLPFLKNPMLVNEEDSLVLSGQTLSSLEVFYSKRRGGKGDSLFGVLNQTQTPMGERMLGNWLTRPLLNKKEIESRLDCIDWYLADRERNQSVKDVLGFVGDIERSIGRLSLLVGGPRDLVVVRSVLSAASRLNIFIQEDNPPESIIELMRGIDWTASNELVNYLNNAIVDEPPQVMFDGGYIKAGFSSKLDQLRDVARGGKGFLTEIERREREETGISSLKIGFNKVFGYYIEVSKANADKVPMHYVRKQTLTNAERYIIEELKVHEDTVLNAQDEALALESELFSQVVGVVLEKTRLLQQVAGLIAYIDVMRSLAAVADENGYVRPEIVGETESDILHIDQGRHPVVEKVLFAPFIPNDIEMSSDDTQMMILTGANMAGKSTFIRQVALLVIMAQIGSFVPAQSMRFSIIDRIHTRIGSADDLTAGLSTFMVEMLETAQIINNLTDRSLVILDEVGRGTSTYDGVSIAWSISEFLLQNSKARVLFATHYHELTEIPRFYNEAKNYNLSVSEADDDVVFLYRVMPGKASRSYGIEVAKRAGLPKKVVDRASEILQDLHVQANAISPARAQQLGLFGKEDNN